MSNHESRNVSSNFWDYGRNPNAPTIQKRNYGAVVSCGALYYAAQGGSNFSESVDKNLRNSDLNESSLAELFRGSVCSPVGKSKVVKHTLLVSQNFKA